MREWIMNYVFNLKIAIYSIGIATITGIAIWEKFF